MHEKGLKSLTKISPITGSWLSRVMFSCSFFLKFNEFCIECRYLFEEQGRPNNFQ